MKLYINISLLTFLTAIITFACSESESEAVFSHSVTQLVEKPDHTQLFDIDSFRKSETVLYGVDNTPSILDVLPAGNNSYFIFDNIEQRLFQWQKNKQTVVVAERGSGPNAIETGFRLEMMNGRPHLLQRPRRSEIICSSTGECRIQAVEVFSKLSTYYEPRDNGEVIRSGYYSPGRSTVILNKNGSEEFFGAVFSHPDLAIAIDLNFNVLIPLPQNAGYLQKFTGQPYIVLLDRDLKATEVFEIENYCSTVIRQTGQRNDKSYSMDFSGETTMSAWYYEQHDGSILLIYRHSTEVPRSSHPMDIETVTSYYDYYRFDPTTLTMEYGGSSENYIIPLRTGFMMIEDYMLHYYEPVELM